MGLYLMRNFFRRAINRRILIQRFFSKNIEYYSQSKLSELREILEVNIHSWQVTWNIIEKKYIKGEYVLDSYYKDYFKKILDFEDRLIRELKVYNDQL